MPIMESIESQDENKPLLTVSGAARVSSTTDNNSPTDEKLRICSLPRRKKLIVLFLTLSNFLTGCGFSLLAPFFPQESEKKDVSNTVNGLIFSSFEFVIFVSSPLFGNYLTRLGPRFLFISGLLIAGVCAVLFGTLDRCPPGIPFITISFACRCVEALGFSAFLTAGFAIISSEFPKNVGTVFALLETADGIGLMVGPAIGGALYELGGFGLPFYVIGVLTVAIGIVMIFLLPAAQGKSKLRLLSREKGKCFNFNEKSNYLVLKSEHCGSFNGHYVPGPNFVQTLGTGKEMIIQRFQLSPALIGLIFVIAPGLYGITSPFWGYVSDVKKINGTLIFIGNLMCGLSYLFIGPSPYLHFLPLELWVIILGLVIIGFFIALAIVPTMNCLLLGAREMGFEDNLDTYGIVAGLFNSVFCLGSFTGPMIGGLLIESIGFRYGATVISGIYLFATVTCGLYFLLRHLKQHSLPDDGDKLRQPVIKSGIKNANQTLV